MDAPIITWSTGELNIHLNSMVKKLSALTDQKEFLENINSEVENAWKGIAGADFDKRMDIDIKNYRGILDDLDALISDLRKAIGKYEECENNIGNEITSLKSKIHK